MLIVQCHWHIAFLSNYGIVAEWRVFIRYGKILGARIYSGNWRAHFDYKIIEQAVKDYRHAPVAYTLDFGLTKEGKTLLIEANDG